jgi:hypothetical protein
MPPNPDTAVPRDPADAIVDGGELPTGRRSNSPWMTGSSRISISVICSLWRSISSRAFSAAIRASASVAPRSIVLGCWVGAPLLSNEKITQPAGQPSHRAVQFFQMQKSRLPSAHVDCRPSPTS